jgi:hypothetical protein
MGEQIMEVPKLIYSLGVTPPPPPPPTTTTTTTLTTTTISILNMSNIYFLYTVNPHHSTSIEIVMIISQQFLTIT